MKVTDKNNLKEGMIYLFENIERNVLILFKKY